MKYAFIQREQAQYPVARLCQVIGVARSGYYAWLKGTPSRREMANQQLAEQVREVHAASRGSYGYPRVHAELRARGTLCTRKRVARLMRKQGLCGRRKRRRRVVTTDSRHVDPIAPNLLNQEFQADAPDQKWCCDITYIPTQGGWLYLAIVLDLFSRKIVGWAMATHRQQTLVHDALNMALVRRQPPPGLMHHSDRGSQYTANAYQDLLRQHELQPSVSRKGNCYDNAPAESFFATLKEEIVTHPFDAVEPFLWTAKKRRIGLEVVRRLT